MQTTPTSSKRIAWIDRIYDELKGLTAVALLLVALGGASNAVMDKLHFHYGKSVFAKLENRQFWDPAISWENKYKDWPTDKRERFPGSTTVLVAFTDAWHLFQQMMFFSFLGAMVLCRSHKWYVFVLALLILSGTFHLFFHMLL